MKLTGKIDDIIKNLLPLDREIIYDVSVVKHIEKRSLDANAYAWILFGKIAEKLRTDKVSIYREFIKRVGKYEVVPIKDEAVETFERMWTKNGLGNLCEELGDSKFRGFKNIIIYYGSSSYNKKEMARLIDEAVEEAKKMDIETLTPDELEKLKIDWER